MSRSFSSALAEALLAPETGEVFIMLLTIDHADLVAPIRVARNHEPVTSRGETYLATAFNLVLPGEQEGTPPTARLQIDNVDRLIVETLREAAEPPTVTLELVLASDPNTVEMTFADMTLRDVRYDALQVEGTLRYESLQDEPANGAVFDSESFPGIFKT